MSTHSVNIIEISKVLPHDKAERLEIVPVNGWQAVVKKGQFRPGDRAIYIEPDYTVPTARPEFSFLAREGRDRHRLKAVRLRGVLSFGLLIPVPDDLADMPVGGDVMASLGIERYEPPIKLAGSDELPHDQHPNVYSSKFDVESQKRFPSVFQPGEPVIVTEKIHGANARYLWSNGIFYIGSRGQWLKPDVDHAWKRAADNDSRVMAWCEAHPNVVLYGEVYGSVQSLRYGHNRGRVSFAAFAALDAGEWVDIGSLIDDASLPTVPLVYRGPYGDHLFDLAEQDSTVPGAEPGHMREGVVIVPERERRHEELGRVVLKHISNRYWESAAA
jgi:RNA ligase (TIGR02306 family)